MTLQSYPSTSEEVVAASGGGSSSASSVSASTSDVYPLPFSLGQKTIAALNNDEQALVSEIADSNFLTPNTNVVIENSSNVDVGNRTVFNRDVTIYQYIQGNNLPEIQNGAVKDEVECNKNDRLSNQRNNQKLLHKWRHLFIPFIILLLLLLILVSLVIFSDSIFNKAPTFPPINPETNNFIQGHPVYSKANWGALPETEDPPILPTPTSVVIISHTATQSCANFTECANQTQYVQYKFLQGGHKDIGYNYLIGGEGGIYEGRGWDHQNSLRAKSISVSFIGDFTRQTLSTPAINATKALLEEGVKIGKLDANYKLIGENQTSPLRYYSPGWNAVKEIKNWEHYFPGTML